MRVLVTGGAGFMGSHLVPSLLKQGHDVSVLDNLSAGKKGRIPKGIRFIKGDVTKAEDVRKASKDAEVIFHLAAMIDVAYSVTHPEETYKINVEGTKNLLEANDGKRFVYVSSAAVYGEATELPISEDHPLKPISPYGESKVKAEQECVKRKGRGTKITILRPFNIYGKGQDPKSPYTGVITKFIENAKAGQPLTIYGDGKSTRDFVNIRDVCDALLLAMKKEGTYNIGTGEPTTINELAALIKELSGSGSAIQHAQPRQGDIRDSYADITCAEKELKWSPKTELREGLKELL